MPEVCREQWLYYIGLDGRAGAGRGDALVWGNQACRKDWLRRWLCSSGACPLPGHAKTLHRLLGSDRLPWLMLGQHLASVLPTVLTGSCP